MKKNPDLHEEQENQQQDWLDEISEYINRALIGIFMFIFQKIPQLCWHGISATFSTVWNALNIGFRRLLNLLNRLVIELPRQVFLWFQESANLIMRLGWNSLKLGLLLGILFGPLITSLILQKLQVFSLAWFGLAFAGCMWGLFNLRGLQIRHGLERLISRLRLLRKPISVEVIPD